MNKTDGNSPKSEPNFFSNFISSAGKLAYNSYQYGKELVNNTGEKISALSTWTFHQYQYYTGQTKTLRFKDEDGETIFVKTIYPTKVKDELAPLPPQSEEVESKKEVESKVDETSNKGLKLGKLILRKVKEEEEPTETHEAFNTEDIIFPKLTDSNVIKFFDTGKIYDYNSNDELF